MADDLTKLWGNFSLSEVESTVVDFLEEDGEEIVEKRENMSGGQIDVG
jgi:Holliday junction resolvase-like predicted endonuclease